MTVKKLESEPFLVDEGLSIAKTVRAMNYLHAEEIFSTPEQSKEFLDSLSFEDFVKWLNFIDGIETNKPIKDRDMGSNSYIEAQRKGDDTIYCKYRPPYPMHRPELVKMAFEKSQSVEDPKIAGLTLSFAINAIHPYDDGNGRTARVIYSLLSKGYSGSDEDKNYYSKILVNTLGQELINPNATACGLEEEIANNLNEECRKKYGYDAESIILTNIAGSYRDKNDDWICAGFETPQDLAVSKDISPDDKIRLHTVLNDSRFTMTSFYRTFSPDRIKKFIVKRDQGYGEGSFISGKGFVSSLSSEEINKFFYESSKVKYEYVKRVINFSDRSDAETYIKKFVD